MNEEVEQVRKIKRLFTETQCDFE